MEWLEVTSIVIELSLLIIALCVFCQTAKHFKESNEKSRNLETIKYISQIRKEIGDLVSEYYDKKVDKKVNEKSGDNLQLISKLDDVSKRIIRQKVEYISVAVNCGIFEKDVIKKLSKNWLCQVIENTGIISDKMNTYSEARKLYDEYNCSSRKQRKVHIS